MSNSTSGETVEGIRDSGALGTPTVAEVDLGRLRRNARTLAAACGPASLMAVVKADAYGHGATRVASELEDLGITWFGVATPAEGITLRRAGVEGRILVFASPLPYHMEAYGPYDLDVVVSTRDVAEAAARQGRLRVHVKVDTGMGRIGIAPSDAGSVISSLEHASDVEIAGLWTHLATADDDDLSFAHEQLDRFRAVVDEVGDAAAHVHVANTAAALRMAETLDVPRPLARLGIGLYGTSSMDGLARDHGLESVMRMTSRVTQVKSVDAGTTISYGRRWTAERPTRIATVGAGYADGYHRRLTNRGDVAIRGRRYPVAGTVCMDMFMVDLGTESDVDTGDEVVLFGTGGPTVYEVASWADTIPYEMLTSVAARVPRLYVG